MDLDFEAVGTGGNRRERHGGNVAGVARGVARVGHDRQVREVVEDGHGVEVKGVARAGLKGADAALAEDHVVIALAHDVFGGHEELIDGSGESALEKHRRAGAADLFEQGEVLRIARADLHHVDLAVAERLNVARVHDLSHDGKACLGPRLAEEVESALAHALVGVGRGAGLVGAAAEHRGTRRLDAPGDADEVLALNRAGSGDYLKVAAADGNAAAVHYRVGRVELAVGFLKGLRDALHALDDVHRFEQEGVDLGRIAHKADDRLVLAVADVRCEALLLDPRDKVGNGALVGVLLEYRNHAVSLGFVWCNCHIIPPRADPAKNDQACNEPVAVGCAVCVSAAVDDRRLRRVGGVPAVCTSSERGVPHVRFLLL